MQDSDNLWWDAFATEFFEDDATLTLSFCLEDGPKRYSKSRVCFSEISSRRASETTAGVFGDEPSAHSDASTPGDLAADQGRGTGGSGLSIEAEGVWTRGRSVPHSHRVPQC